MENKTCGIVLKSNQFLNSLFGHVALNAAFGFNHEQIEQICMITHHRKEKGFVFKKYAITELEEMQFFAERMKMFGFDVALNFNGKLQSI